MPEWSRLRDAYGSAEDLPSVLESAESSGDWDEAYSRLFHQGTTYTASFAALPMLTEMALRQPAAGHVAAMDLAAAILSSQDLPTPEASVRARSDHAQHIGALRALAERRLSEAGSDGEFVYLLQALMAFEDVDPWQRSLDYLADGAAPLTCPTCDQPLLLDLTGAPCTVSSVHDRDRLTEVRPAAPSPGHAEHRLLELAESHGRSPLADPLRALFGTARCPSCPAEFDIADAIV